MIETKICIRCNIEKLLNEFNKNSASKDKKHHYCRECQKILYHEYSITRKKEKAAYDKKYKIEHKKERAAYDKKYNINNRKKRHTAMQQFYKLHPNYRQEYRIINYEKLLIKARREQAIRKGWGEPRPINEDFYGAQLHHMHINGDHQICIYIPTDIHKSIFHAWHNAESMEKINQKCWEWYNSII